MGKDKDSPTHLSLVSTSRKKQGHPPGNTGALFADWMITAIKADHAQRAGRTDEARQLMAQAEELKRMLNASQSVGKQRMARRRPQLKPVTKDDDYCSKYDEEHTDSMEPAAMPKE